VSQQPHFQFSVSKDKKYRIPYPSGSQTFLVCGPNVYLIAIRGSPRAVKLGHKRFFNYENLPQKQVKRFLAIYF